MVVRVELSDDYNVVIDVHEKATGNLLTPEQQIELFMKEGIKLLQKLPVSEIPKYKLDFTVDYLCKFEFTRIK